jgi:pimeloyl-ACP methyl ester carboxylesterase
MVLPYRLFVPEGTVPGTKYPLVLALHGAGERGTDNRIQIEANRLATVWADPANQAGHPCFVVAPQCPPGDGWSTADPFTPSAPAAAALEMLDSLIREFPIDTNRQYITGLSMGGFGTWALIINDPYRFAAAVPVCGGENPVWTSRLLEVPIWNFHGANDDVVPVGFSRGLVAALESQGRRAVYTHCKYLDCRGLPDSTVASAVGSRQELLYTEYPGVAHNSWEPAYNEPLLIPWVFGFTRRVPDAIRLTSLTSPAVIEGDQTITWTTAAPGDSVELWFSGDAGDSWSLLSGPVFNTGSYVWKTDSVEDCAFGRVRAVLIKQGGVNAGSDQTAFFSVNNAPNGAPTVRILNPEFFTDPLFDQDSLDLRLLVGDPEWGPVDVTIAYDAGGGGPLEGVASFSAASDTVEQIRRIGIAGLPNSNRAMIRAYVSDGSSVGSASTSPFVKRTPRATGPSAKHVEGTAGADIVVNVVDPSALTGHTYRVEFTHTPPSTTVYDVIDATASATLLTGIGGLDGSTEGPAFDGVRLVVSDHPVAAVDLDSSRWVRGEASVTASIFVPSRNIGGVQYTGFAYPYDYMITIASAVVDTSIAAFGLDAVPIKFSVFNLTLGAQADVGFFDGDGDGTISSLDEVDLLERDSSGSYQLSWAVFFVQEAGDVLPVPGDQFLLRTRKPLRSDDVYEFTTSLSSAGEGVLPTSFRLEQNYPNPFNGETVIRYEVGPGRAGGGGRSYVGLKVYDMLGREVATLVDGPLAPGAYEARFAPVRLATGVYVYRLDVDGVLQARKMLYLR